MIANFLSHSIHKFSISLFLDILSTFQTKSEMYTKRTTTSNNFRNNLLIFRCNEKMKHKTSANRNFTPNSHCFRNLRIKLITKYNAISSFN